MAETVTTLERAIEVMNEVEYAGCKGWRLNGDTVVSPGPTLFGERNPAISRNAAIRVANKLSCYAKPKDAEPAPTPVDLGRLAYETAQATFGRLDEAWRYASPWVDVRDSVKAGWIAAAVAVVDQMPAAKPPQVGPKIGPQTQYVMEQVAKAVRDVDEFCNYLAIHDEYDNSSQIHIKTKNAILALRECGMEGDSR